MGLGIKGKVRKRQLKYGDITPIQVAVLYWIALTPLSLDIENALTPKQL